MYEAQADISVGDIAADIDNQISLSRLKRNDADDENIESLWIQNVHEEDDEEHCIYYCPEGAYEVRILCW